MSSRGPFLLRPPSLWLMTCVHIGTVGDVRALPFEDESVDVCFDKATLDAMLTSEKDPWVRPPLPSQLTPSLSSV